MKKRNLLLLALLLNFTFSISQTKTEIDSLLNEITKTENSKEIIDNVDAKRIIAHGENSLMILAEFFVDTTLTKVKSECNDRYLTKGEIAIILADRIERMPYFTVTRIRNCTLTFCKNNTNLIEYYFSSNNYLNNKVFRDRYVEWLYSKDRLKEVKGKARRERKRLLKEWKATFQ
ncbi:MAG: hypothetical protein AB8B65_15570 [Kordia sp.]|uniref:hypothetical protein n=1 Tax=Kordia sp. TaxID=1965332 RepID=UPI00385B407D